MARKFFNGIDVDNQKLIHLGSPSSPTDAANKAYVDAKIKGQVWKPGVRAASTTNIELSSPGDTVDGVTLDDGDSILLKDQTDKSENGIYLYPGGSSALMRRDDVDDDDEMLPNTSVFVSEGSANEDTAWTLITDAPIHVGTTDLVFAQTAGKGEYTAGKGLDRSGTEFSVKAATGITVGNSGVGIDESLVARKYSTTIGNGSATTIEVSHELGTRAVVVSVHDATSFEEVYPDVEKTTTNKVILTFAEPPSTGAYVVTVIG